jgi:hypothetical protein
MEVARKKSFQKMYAEEHTTEEICDGVKYGPNKFDLVKSGQNQAPLIGKPVHSMVMPGW